MTASEKFTIRPRIEPDTFGKYILYMNFQIIWPQIVQT